MWAAACPDSGVRGGADLSARGGRGAEAVCLGARLRAVVALACAEPAPTGDRSRREPLLGEGSAPELVWAGAGACPGQNLLDPGSERLPRRWTFPSLANGI